MLAQFILEMCATAKNHNKITKTPHFGFKIVDFGANQKGL